MQPNQIENKIEQKIEQVQNPSSQILPNSPPITEPSPTIKTEENQANWKVFREQREAERKAKELADKRAYEKAEEAAALRAALEALANKPSNNYNSRDNDSQDTEESEDQRIKRRVEEIIKEREILAEKQKQEKEQQEFPTRLINTYHDFNQVCTSENLDYLEYHFPEVATPFKYLADGYEKWAAVYKAVKRFVPNLDSRHDSHRAEKNLQKPGSISSPGRTQGESALPSAKLDESRKAANWERMQRVIKSTKD